MGRLAKYLPTLVRQVSCILANGRPWIFSTPKALLSFIRLIKLKKVRVDGDFSVLIVYGKLTELPLFAFNLTSHLYWFCQYHYTIIISTHISSLRTIFSSVFFSMAMNFFRRCSSTDAVVG